jgi:hypothetical protein
MTRNGKIARLPRYIREELNARLREGEQGKQLVQWLNALKPVQEILSDQFHSSPISEQNLSEWKQGGFQDWLRHQDSLEWVKRLQEESGELAEEVGLLPLSDRLSPSVALAFGRLLATAAAGDLKDTKCRDDLIALARELSALRKDDHEAARLQMEIERYQREQAAREAREDAAAIYAEEWGGLNRFVKALTREKLLRDLTKHLPEEAAEQVREMVGMKIPKVSQQNHFIPTGSPPQTQSNPIRPDQT